MQRAAERWGCWIDGRRFAVQGTLRAARREYERPYLHGDAKVMNLASFETWKRFGLTWRLERAAEQNRDGLKTKRGVG